MRNGWQGANDIPHRKRVEDFGNLKKFKRVEARRRTRRFDFWGLLRREEFARYGRRARWEPDEKANIKRLSLSLCGRTFKLKSNKRFVPKLRSRYVFFIFQDSYVLSLWTFDVRFTHSHIMAMVQYNQYKNRKLKLLFTFWFWILNVTEYFKHTNITPLAQSAGVVEYTDWYSVEE